MFTVNAFVSDAIYISCKNLQNRGIIKGIVLALGFLLIRCIEISIFVPIIQFEL